MNKRNIKRLENTNKKIYKQWGFSWKGAKKVLSNKEEIIKIIQNGSWAHYDIEENDESILFKFYSSNDMF